MVTTPSYFSIPGFQKDGVGGERTLHGIALRVRLVHGGCDDVDLFAAAGAPLAAMGIKRGHGHSRMLKSSQMQGIVERLHRVENPILA